MDLRQSELFATLWVSSLPSITAFVRTLTPDFQQAEEILQRVAVMLVRKFDEYDPTRPFAAWAIGFAKNEILYYRRQRATDKLVFDEDIIEKIAVTYKQIIAEIEPMREALGNCVDELQGRSRQVIELRYGSGLNSGQIAARMKLTAGAVRVLLYRVRAVLRDCIERRVALEPE